MQMAHCAALGVPFLGFSIYSQMRVHYIDGEMGPIFIQDRLQKMECLYPGAADNLFFTMFPDQGVEKAMLQVPDIDLFIIDPAISIRYDDENNSAEVRARLDNLHHIAREVGAAIIIVHHTRKNLVGVGRAGLKEARGSGAFLDWVDGGLYLHRPDREKDEFTIQFLVRGAEEPPDMVVVRDPTTLTYHVVDGTLQWKEVVEQCLCDWQVETRRSGWPPTEELVRRVMARTGKSRATVYRNLSKILANMSKEDNNAHRVR